MHKYKVMIDMGVKTVEKILEFSDSEYQNIQNLFMSNMPVEFYGGMPTPIGHIIDIELINEDNNAQCELCPQPATHANNTLCLQCWADAEGIPSYE